MKQLILIASFLIASLCSIAQDKHQCAATTKKGTQCMHKTAGKFCKQHDPATPKCGAPTKAGKPCSRSVKNAGDKCFQHKPAGNSLLKESFSKDGISVVYTYNKDTFALDYLTKSEYNTLISTLNK
jgi:hypothetical protein